MGGESSPQEPDAAENNPERRMQLVTMSGIEDEGEGEEEHEDGKGWDGMGWDGMVEREKRMHCHDT